MEIVITVNGRRRNFSIKENELLINLLRDEMHLTGTKYGCGIGECGACTVLLDQEPVLACMTLAIETDGRTVETIENVAKGVFWIQYSQLF
jgi:carbon-monoxide dehydrogenase small subunit